MQITTNTQITTNFSLPNSQTIHHEQLKNGVTVLVYENHSAPSAVVVGSLHSGTIYEDLTFNGLASMTAGALLRGTVDRDFDTFHGILEGIGADLHFHTGTHRVSFEGKALAEDLPLLVDLLADALRYPTFPEDQVERMRGERLTGLRYSQQDTGWQAGRLFRELLYPKNHAYHYGIRGTLETVPLITLDAIRQFHREIYGPQGMVLVVVGDVDTTDVVELVRAKLGDWRNAAQPAQAQLPAIRAPQTPRHSHVAVPGKSQANLMIGTLGPSRYEPDFQAARLANSVLGMFGMMGRIGDVVREREGMAYYAGSRIDGGVGPGAWSISAGVDPANIGRTIELCLQQVEELITTPVSDEELAENQSYYTGHLPLQLESNHGIAATLHSMEAFDLGLDYLMQYRDMIYSLTVEDLLAAAQRYLDPAAMVIATAGPELA